MYRHLDAIETKYHSLIRSELQAQLCFDPTTASRNRKPLRQPMEFGADWELRLGPANRFRIFYQVETDNRRVRVLAIGEKDRSRLFIGGEEYTG